MKMAENVTTLTKELQQLAEDRRNWESFKSRLVMSSSSNISNGVRVDVSTMSRPSPIVPDPAATMFQSSSLGNTSHLFNVSSLFDTGTLAGIRNSSPVHEVVDSGSHRALTDELRRLSRRLLDSEAAVVAGRQIQVQNEATRQLDACRYRFPIQDLQIESADRKAQIERLLQYQRDASVSMERERAELKQASNQCALSQQQLSDARTQLQVSFHETFQQNRVEIEHYKEAIEAFRVKLQQQEVNSVTLQSQLQSERQNTQDRLTQLSEAERKNSDLIKLVTSIRSECASNVDSVWDEGCTAGRAQQADMTRGLHTEHTAQLDTARRECVEAVRAQHQLHEALVRAQAQLNSCQQITRNFETDQKLMIEHRAALTLQCARLRTLLARSRTHAITATEEGKQSAIQAAECVRKSTTTEHKNTELERKLGDTSKAMQLSEHACTSHRAHAAQLTESLQQTEIFSKAANLQIASLGEAVQQIRASNTRLKEQNDVLALANEHLRSRVVPGCRACGTSIPVESTQNLAELTSEVSSLRVSLVEAVDQRDSLISQLKQRNKSSPELDTANHQIIQLQQQCIAKLEENQILCTSLQTFEQRTVQFEKESIQWRERAVHFERQFSHVQSMFSAETLAKQHLEAELIGLKNQFLSVMDRQQRLHSQVVNLQRISDVSTIAI